VGFRLQISLEYFAPRTGQIIRGYIKLANPADDERKLLLEIELKSARQLGKVREL
jgi:hypothetical protein